MNDDDLRAAFDADAELDAVAATDPAPEVLAEIRARVGVRRRARFAGLAVVVTFVLIGGAVLTAGLRGTDESSLIVADDGSSNAGTTPGTSGGGSHEPVKVLLTGDSFGYTLGYGFENNPDTRDVAVWNQAVLYCGVVPLQRDAAHDGGRPCAAWDQADGAAALRQFHPDVVVHALGPTDVLDAIAEDGSVVPIASGDYGARFVKALVAQAVAADAVGAPLVILTAPPWELDPSVHADPAEPRPEWTRAEIARVHRINDLARQAATQAPPGTISVIEFGDWLCPGDDVCRTTESGTPMRSDGVHFDDRSDGAREAAAWLAPQLVQLAGEPVEDPGTSVAAPTTWNGASGDAGTLDQLGPDPNDAEGADPCSQVTTIPSCTQPTPSPSVTTPVTPAPTMPGGPIDCGGAYPISGWPTTMMTSSQGADCIVSAFTSGTDATFWVIDFVRNADGSSDQTTVERRDFHVTGTGRVDVVIGRRPIGNGPFDPYGELHGCTQLTKVRPDSQQVAVAGCS